MPALVFEESSGAISESGANEAKDEFWDTKLRESQPVSEFPTEVGDDILAGVGVRSIAIGLKAQGEFGTVRAAGDGGCEAAPRC